MKFTIASILAAALLATGVAADYCDNTAYIGDKCTELRAGKHICSHNRGAVLSCQDGKWEIETQCTAHLCKCHEDSDDISNCT